jgi:hypothetical protein
MKDDKKPSQQMKVNINLYWKYQGIHGCIVIENILQKYNWKMRKMEVTINLKVFLDHIPKKKIAFPIKNLLCIQLPRSNLVSKCS